MITPRPHLQDLPTCPHGSVGDDELARFGLRAGDVIDFSANTNPLGPPTGVRDAIASASVSRYPDGQAAVLRDAIADSIGLPATNVIVGNGSAEIIWLLALAYLAPGDRAVIVGPTFGEYARAIRIAGAEPVEVCASPDQAFQPCIDAVVDAIRISQPRLVFLCNPNNPTGALVIRSQIARILEACSAALLVVDEAYRCFCDDAPDLLDLLVNRPLFLIRSMTKDYALAGLRLGYGVGADMVVDVLNRARPPWSVNSAAQAAGLAAIADPAHLERSRAAVSEARAYLVAALGGLKMGIVPPSANFVLVRVGNARDLRERLLKRGVCVRDCTSFGLPEYIRIGVKTRPECERLVRELREEVG